MRCDRSAYGDLRRQSYLAIVFFAAWLAAMLAAGMLYGQEEPSEPALTHEPKALLAPVNLLPVDPAAETVGTKPSSPVAAPPVQLAPDITAWSKLSERSAADAAEEIKPANFQEVTPGETTREQVLTKLGEPAEVDEQDGTEVLSYTIGPFPTVKVSVRDNVVSSIVIHLAAPSGRADVAKELGLASFQPAIVSDDRDRPLGEVYPERGLMFAYAEGTSDLQEARVAHVILETITVESFLLRAQQQPTEDFAKRLLDFESAQQLDSENPLPLILAAHLDLLCGKPLSALEAARKAVALDDNNVEYQITLADTRRRLGQSREALESLRAILQQTDLTPLDQARARFLYGRLLATLAPRDYRQAMEETVSAIKLSAAQAEQAKGDTRRQLRQVLIDSELSLAEILACGPWKQKHQVVPQWLATAEKTAHDFIQKDGGPQRTLLSVYSTSLHCLLVLQGQGTPDKIADAAMQLGRDLIAQTDDEGYHAAIEWQLGTALWYAAQIANHQGHGAAALQYANNADALLTSGGKTRLEAPETTHHLGQLRFLTGSIYAIHHKDDATAVRWYDRALPHLQPTYPDSLLDERGLLGEQLVSVGISLWESGRRNTAVSVTQEGASLIAQAVQDGELQRSALSVPYQNLALMQRELGNTEEADRLADKAVEADPQAESAIKRR
ncbi:MAG: tetratricopeptide repeat protein [Pirellulaceae bacterium]